MGEPHWDQFDVIYQGSLADFIREGKLLQWRLEGEGRWLFKVLGGSEAGYGGAEVWTRVLFDGCENSYLQVVRQVGEGESAWCAMWFRVWFGEEERLVAGWKALKDGLKLVVNREIAGVDSKLDLDKLTEKNKWRVRQCKDYLQAALTTGITQDEFCGKKNYGKSTLQAWLKKFNIYF